MIFFIKTPLSFFRKTISTSFQVIIEVFPSTLFCFEISELKQSLDLATSSIVDVERPACATVIDHEQFLVRVNPL